MYAKGQGVVQDDVEAVKWYKLAAAQENAAAQYNLGLMYYKGRGVAQDYIQAYMWSNLAAMSGDKDSVINRDNIAKLMTKQQLAEAQKLARECLVRKYKGCQTKPKLTGTIRIMI
jgi:TPR repeat protein